MRLESRSQFHTRELITNLTLKNLRSTYNDSALGFGWSLLNPLITILVYAAVFTFILRGRGAVGDPSGLTQYGLFLAAGILPWQFGSNSITGAANSLVGARGLLQKLYVPKWILPFSGLLARLTTFLVELSILTLVLGLGWGVWVYKYLHLLLALLVLYGAYLFGFGLFLSVLNVYFRDIEHVFTIGIRLWFWLTPIIYPLSLIEDQDRTILGMDAATVWKINPMLWFIQSFRDLLFHVRAPSLAAYGIMAAWAAASLLFGWAVYRRMSPGLVDRL